MDFIESFQEYFFRRKGVTADSAGGVSTESGRAQHRCCSHCSFAGGAARKRDSSTSTHDLSTYVWLTEGDGVGISNSIEDESAGCCSCRTTDAGFARNRQCSFGAGSQPNKRCKREAMCDASTSTFDLTSYVWGTEGDMWAADSGLEESMENDGHDLGMDDAGSRWGGLNRKRPSAASTLGINSRSHSGQPAASPRKKKRRVGN